MYVHARRRRGHSRSEGGASHIGKKAVLPRCVDKVQTSTTKQTHTMQSLLLALHCMNPNRIRKNAAKQAALALAWLTFPSDGTLLACPPGSLRL